MLIHSSFRFRLRGLLSFHNYQCSFARSTRGFCTLFPACCSNRYSSRSLTSSLSCRVSFADFWYDSRRRRSGPCYFFSTSVAVSRLRLARDHILEIVDIVVKNEVDLESRLESLNIVLSVDSLDEVFKVLNEKRSSGLRFFRWFRCWQPNLSRNSDACSLCVDNCGHLEDYSTMRSILNEFKEHNICLTKSAFRFLLLIAERESSARDSTLRIIEILRDAGGSCYASGTHALVECFCSVGSHGMATFVAQQVERKDAYYNVIIREMCRRNDVKAAREMIVELRKEKIQLETQALNYLISCLCKMDYGEAWKIFLELQDDQNCEPDALTFEILICSCCKTGKIDDSFQLVGNMAIKGLEPRLSTHAFIIKSLFKLQRYEDAHTYVVHMANKYKFSGNFIYSLLASVHQKNGNFSSARKIVYEMIEKGLKPESKLYLTVMKWIRRKSF